MTRISKASASVPIQKLKPANDPDFYKKLLMQFCISATEQAISQMQAGMAKANEKLKKSETGES